MENRIIKTNLYSIISSIEYTDTFEKDTLETSKYDISKNDTIQKTIDIIEEKIKKYTIKDIEIGKRYRESQNLESRYDNKDWWSDLEGEYPDPEFKWSVEEKKLYNNRRIFRPKLKTNLHGYSSYKIPSDVILAYTSARLFISTKYKGSTYVLLTEYYGKYSVTGDVRYSTYSYNLIGGKREDDDGNNPVETIKRESYEELGLAVGNTRLRETQINIINMFTDIFKMELPWVFNHRTSEIVFIVHLNDSYFDRIKIPKNQEGIFAFRWFPLDYFSYNRHYIINTRILGRFFTIKEKTYPPGLEPKYNFPPKDINILEYIPLL